MQLPSAMPYLLVMEIAIVVLSLFVTRHNTFNLRWHASYAIARLLHLFRFFLHSTMTLRLPFRPQPHRVDARSLAAFRILLSVYILHDIYRRLEHGRLSLAWYYSSADDGSYFLPPILDPTDSPHGSPVHKLWFYRGSPQLQIAIFAMTSILAVLFGFGFHCQITSILLWLFMNGIQNRSPHLADGSDLYMIAELTCPAACLLASCDGNSWRHIPAILLMLFHLSLFACMRVFNWQFMSILCCIIFIPSNVWDRLQSLEEPPMSKAQDSIGNKSLGGKVRNLLSSFFLFYMAYNWCGERRWIAKHDNGDIGEFLRFNQNWLMYGPDVSRTTMATLITGKVQQSEPQRNNSTDSRRLDILKAIRDNDWGGKSEIDHSTYMFMRYEETPGDMAARFPSWRWEVSLKDWVKERVKPRFMTPARRSERLGRVLCVAANDARKDYAERITHVELAFWSMRTLDFEKASMEHRFDRLRDDLVVEVEC